MKNLIRSTPALLHVVMNIEMFLKAYFPKIRAKIAYQIAYGKKCDLENPKSLSEKLLWLSLNTYRNNYKIMELCDKYLVRDYVAKKASPKYLNELYSVYNNIDEIDYDQLPQQFALKVSQGCANNIICHDKNELSREKFESTLKEWKTGQQLYDKIMADIGGVSRKKLPKYYICEKLLVEDGKQSPTDYKFYCFNGEPKAILVISDRFSDKTGLFMKPDWTFLSELSGSYHKPSKIYDKPQSLDDMLFVAKALSQDFPFVRVDMYDVNGQAIFGEMTFFPNGCVHLQETIVDGKTMGELLDIK